MKRRRGVAKLAHLRQWLKRGILSVQLIIFNGGKEENGGKMEKKGGSGTNDEEEEEGVLLGFSLH